MSKHTAGPWMIADKDFVYALSKQGVNEFSCSVQGGYNDEGKRTTKGEIEANAALIAAAPDLLESLQDLTSWALAHTGPSDNTKDMLIKAVMAIAKATRL